MSCDEHKFTSHKPQATLHKNKMINNLLFHKLTLTISHVRTCPDSTTIFAQLVLYDEKHSSTIGYIVH